MAKRDFELVRLKNENDIFEALQRNGRVFSIWKKRLFCEDIFREMLVEWVVDHWEERPYGTLPKGAGETQEDEKVFAFTKGVKPWPVFQQMIDRKAKEFQAEREKEIAECKRKVLGWAVTPFQSLAFLKKDFEDDEENTAVIADIRRHGYCFAGQDHQEREQEAVYPILDDYRYHSFSRRGFGDLMAEAHGVFSEFGYARYTEASLIEDQDLSFPPKTKTLEEDNPPFEFDLLEDAFDAFVAWNQERNPCYFVLPLGQGHYWLNDVITLRCGEKKWSGKIKALHCFQSREELDEYYEDVDELIIPYQEKDIEGEYPKLLALLKDADEERYKPHERYFYDNKEHKLRCLPSTGFQFFVYDESSETWKEEEYRSEYFQGAYGFYEEDPNRFVLIGAKAELVTDERFLEAVSKFPRD